MTFKMRKKIEILKEVTICCRGLMEHTSLTPPKKEDKQNLFNQLLLDLR